MSAVLVVLLSPRPSLPQVFDCFHSSHTLHSSPLPHTPFSLPPPSLTHPSLFPLPPSHIPHSSPSLPHTSLKHPPLFVIIFITHSTPPFSLVINPHQPTTHCPSHIFHPPSSSFHPPSTLPLLSTSLVLPPPSTDSRKKGMPTRSCCQSELMRRTRSRPSRSR